MRGEGRRGGGKEGPEAVAKGVLYSVRHLKKAAE